MFLCKQTHYDYYDLLMISLTLSHTCNFRDFFCRYAA